MPLLPFTKLHGLGNDFALFDGLDVALPAWLTDPEGVQQLCDRRFGIGGDGLLLLLPSNTSALGRMRVLNADGSEPEMCGNGLRCVAHYLVQHHGASAERPFHVETGAGLLPCLVVEASVEGAPSRISVEMGKPSLEPKDLPMEANEPQIDVPLSCEGRIFTGTAVSMGNPHFVIFEDDPRANLQQLARDFGPVLEHHPSFPNRVNVEFVRVHNASAMEAWVWERGTGLTLACGTGACAVGVAATLTKRVGPGPLSITLPGGDLEIVVAADLSGVTMTGPAVESYRGKVPIGSSGLISPGRPAIQARQ
ncbi:MAG: diaminopimelate epimerase [Deltaproteobacteria bacterium]|nr:diaminopimelate epimerase [Deltaproteobacteria bacterium]